MSEPAPNVQKELATKPVRRYRSLIFQGYLLAAILAFALLALLASSSAYFPIDLVITKFFQAWHTAWLDLIMRAVSWLGYTPQILLVSLILILLLIALKLYREGAALLIDAMVLGAANNLVKIVVHRPRPRADLVTVVRELASYSFPSGHVMFYTGFFGFLFFLSFTHLKKSWLRSLLLLFFGSLVFLVGPSRIYLGEHWASDVLGAYLLGSLVLLGVIQTYRLWTSPSNENGSVDDGLSSG